MTGHRRLRVLISAVRMDSGSIYPAAQPRNRVTPIKMSNLPDYPCRSACPRSGSGIGDIYYVSLFLKTDTAGCYQCHIFPQAITAGMLYIPAVLTYSNNP